MTQAIGFTPIYRIERGGVDVTQKFNDRALMISVKHSSNGESGNTCTIVLDDRGPDGQGFGIIAENPVPGDWLTLSLGYAEVGLAYQGAFQINRVEYSGQPKQITLQGSSYDITSALKEPVLQSFEGLTIDQLVSKLGEIGGVQAVVHSSFNDKKVPFKNIIGQSPMHILDELGRHFNAIPKIADGKLSFTPRDEGETASGWQMTQVIVRPQDFGTEWSFVHTQRPQYKKTAASYLDDKTGRPVWVEAMNKVFNELGDNNAPEVVNRMSKQFKTREEAQAAADARMAALQRSEFTGSLSLSKGNPWVKDQQIMVITGMRVGIDGKFTIEEVEHTLTKGSGLQTKCTVKSMVGDLDFETDALDPTSFIDPSRIAPSGRVGGSV